MTNTISLPALALERRLDTRLWGGHRLGAWLGLPNAPEKLAESWQVYAQNRVLGGPFAGRTLAQLAQEYGPALVGTRSFARYGPDFPLLAKFIDAADHLSVQVHPDDTYAHTVEAASGFHGKTEAWYILDAEPGAELFHGLKNATDREQFAAGVADGSVIDMLRRMAVKPGDIIFVPAGTLHAINAGILLFEIQQTSDLTYRVYDYDRRDADGRPRELHLERALDVIDYAKTGPALVEPVELGDGRRLLVTCPYFRMEHWQLHNTRQHATSAESFEIVTVIDGETQLACQHGTWTLRRGDSLVLPASLGEYTLHTTHTATLLVCRVPE